MKECRNPLHGGSFFPLVQLGCPYALNSKEDRVCRVGAGQCSRSSSIEGVFMSILRKF